MECETILTFIAVGGSLLGAVIGGVISMWVTKKQLSANYKEQKLMVLDNQLQKLHKVSDKLRSYKITYQQFINDPSAVLGFFTNHVNEFLTLSYLYPENIENEYLDIDERIKSFQMDMIKGKTPDHKDVKEIQSEIGRLHSKIYKLIRGKMRKLHTEIENLTMNQ